MSLGGSEERVERPKENEVVLDDGGEGGVGGLGLVTDLALFSDFYITSITMYITINFYIYLV